MGWISRWYWLYHAIKQKQQVLTKTFSASVTENEGSKTKHVFVSKTSQGRKESKSNHNNGLKMRL